MNETRLAIEWSSTRLSVAWQQGDQLKKELLELKRFQAELALPMLEKVVRGLSDLREIRIGRGPGNYSGIRQALAWSFGYTAPGGVALKVYSSGRAQAYRIAENNESPFAILGDARRGVWWGMIWGKGEDNWRLQSPEAWAEEIGDMPVYSQEAGRLSSAPFGVTADFPCASDLLMLPEEAAFEDAAPLYLHPPV